MPELFSDIFPPDFFRDWSRYHTAGIWKLIPTMIFFFGQNGSIIFLRWIGLCELQHNPKRQDFNAFDNFMKTYQNSVVKFAITDYKLIPNDHIEQFAKFYACKM